MKRKLLVLLILLPAIDYVSYGAIGDVFDLGDALRDSVAAAQNPYNDSNDIKARWYFHNAPGNIYDMPITAPVTQANNELPSAGSGWTWTPSGSHLSLSVFDANDGANTNYQIDSIGGHAPTGTTWQTLLGGTFKVECSAYKARIAKNGAPLTLILDLAGLGSVIVEPILDSIHPDSANAFVPTPWIVAMNPDEGINCYFQGGDWAGMTFTVTEVDPADIQLTISTEPAYVNTVLPFVGTQTNPVAGWTPIDAQLYINCANNGEVLSFDHWEIIQNAVIADVNSASTSVRFTDVGPAEIRAVYLPSNYCGDPCHPQIIQDLTNDCLVNLLDLARFAQQWQLDASPQP